MGDIAKLISGDGDLTEEEKQSLRKCEKIDEKRRRGRESG